MGCFVPLRGGGAKQPSSVLSGAVAGCDRFLLTPASLGDAIAFEGTSRAMMRLPGRQW